MTKVLSSEGRETQATEISGNSRSGRAREAMTSSDESWWGVLGIFRALPMICLGCRWDSLKKRD
eukprot:1354286-Amorphochlora_amoeboformis.AAC.1